MAIHLTPEANPTVQEGTLYVDSATGEFNVAGRTVPHIIPGVLYPAVSGNDIHGTDIDTSHGSTYTYGTAHTDGRKYYYTDIKGSKPIKDPRIGGHFGSQRHKFKSLQLLEQETATHGKNVYSVDGREWVRAVDNIEIKYDDSGNYCRLLDTSSFIEIVGYFSDFNWSHLTLSDRTVRFTIDGGTENSTDYGSAAVASPLNSRYVDTHSLINIPISQSLGIHTIKIRRTGAGNEDSNGFELIAQDTTSTANRSKIQIPSQNVVSYGKKFTVSGTPHYDPFNGMSGAKTLTQLGDYIDTATSLGMENWKAGTANYYKPFNGGRVIKWVDSSGTIKTSVTMMPPNAQNFSATASNAVTNTEVQNGTNGETINFDTTTLANATPLSEVAKTFLMREFGNGGANAGTGGANYADASMLSGNDAIAYVMDDGLTSLSAKQIGIAGSGTANAFGYVAQYGDAENYLTFIGTGFDFRNKTSSGDDRHDIVQNLPYGSHIFYQVASGNYPITFDGVSLGDHRPNSRNTDFGFYEVTIYQPKKPPIPEDACVIADYMLMADFVAKGATGIDKISKGIRACSVSRDLFYDSGGSFSFDHNPEDAAFGFQSYNNNNTSLYRITSFSTGMGFNGASHTNRIDNAQFKLNGSNFSYNASNIYDLVGEGDDTNDDGTLDLRGTSQVGGTVFGVKNQTLGNNIYEVNNNSNTGYQLHTFIEAHTPIHTSHHYQPFETPYLHELIGGDRNMEQTNLVCSPDGKTWDEVTRDTSYMGLEMLCADDETSYTSSTDIIKFDVWRGSIDGNNMGNKNFAIAYDRQICLRDGMYEITASTIKNINTTYHVNILVNGVRRKLGHSTNISHDTITNIITTHLKRGDYVQIEGGWRYTGYSHFQITRVG